MTKKISIEINKLPQNTDKNIAHIHYKEKQDRNYSNKYIKYKYKYLELKNKLF